MSTDNEWNRNENALRRRLAGGSYERRDITDPNINATNPQLDAERIKLLAEALAKVLIFDGVIREDRPYTGPELLTAAESYVEGCGDG